MIQKQQQQPQQTNVVQEASQYDFIINNNQDQPMDTVSQIAWFPNPQMKLFLSSCWDGKLLIYDVVSGSQYGAQTALVKKMSLDLVEPLTAACWKSDGTKIYVAADMNIKEIDVQTQQVITIGSHSQGISGLFQIPNTNALISTSYDSTFKIWQGANNQTQPQQFRLKHKIFAADLKYPQFLMGLQNEKLLALDLNQIGQYNENNFQYIDSPLGVTSQIQCVSLFANGQGLAIGSIDGRANLSKITIDQRQQLKLENIMTFKCHKTESNGQNGPKQQTMYSVNSIGFNARNDKFLYTAGGDGNMYFWDFDAKNKITSFNLNQQSISAASIDSTGNLLAYSTGYDYHQGLNGLNKYTPKIRVHQILDQELKHQGRNLN